MSSHTTLNLRTPAAARVARGAGVPSSDCPTCGAKKNQRVTEASFGPTRSTTFCGHCGHVFTDQEHEA